MDNNLVKPKSKLHKWYETNVAEIYMFIANVLLMPHIEKSSMSDYWSKDSLIATPIFRTTMTKDKFFLLLCLIHFCDNKFQAPGDSLFKISTILQTLKI